MHRCAYVVKLDHKKLKLAKELKVEFFVESKKLTVKQQKFVENYAQTGNGAESARMAGYSANVAKVQAHENLTKPNIKSALAEKRAEITAENADKREFFISHLESLAKTAQKE